MAPQVLPYENGQQYGAHYDSLQGGAPRVATVLMYLSADPLLRGGETAFPEVRARRGSLPLPVARTCDGAAQSPVPLTYTPLAISAWEYISGSPSSMCSRSAQHLARHPRHLPLVAFGDQAGTCHVQASVWWDAGAARRRGPFSACAQGHVAVRPRLGARPHAAPGCLDGQRVGGQAACLPYKHGLHLHAPFARCVTSPHPQHLNISRFPQITAASVRKPWRIPCLNQGALARAGDALLFYNLHADGSLDPHAMHAGCPVLGGVKWTATKWLHAEPFHPDWLQGAGGAAEDAPLPDECADAHANCQHWADAGAQRSLLFS